MDKQQFIIDFFTKQLPMQGKVALPEFQSLIDTSSVLKLVAGEVLFHEKLPCPYYFILVQGVAKMVYTKTDGKQWVKSFLVTGDGFASLSALANGGTASYSTIAVSPCTIIKISFYHIQQLASTYLEWANLMAAIAIEYASRKEVRERDLLTLTPEQRYLKIRENQPIWLSLVTQADLAKHLGITAVDLNRIIKRLEG